MQERAYPLTVRRRGLTPIHLFLALAGLALWGEARAEEPETPIVAVGDRIDLRDAEGLALSGNWARVYPAYDGGWRLFVTGGDTYNVMEMDADFNVTTPRRRLVSDWPERLVDHQISECPDGT